MVRESVTVSLLGFRPNFQIFYPAGPTGAVTVIVTLILTFKLSIYVTITVTAPVGPARVKHLLSHARQKRCNMH